MVFFAYSADEPKAMTIFTGAAYVASIPPGMERQAGSFPNTGSGPAARRAPLWPAALAAGGVLAFGAAWSSRRRHR
jgi:hypothetical protein